MTNNLLVKADEIKFNLNFTVTSNDKPAIRTKGMIDKPEVLVVGLSNNIYRIKTFDQYLPNFDLSGYGILMFKSSEGYIVLLEQFEEQNLFNLKMAFDKTFKYDKRRYCSHNYLDATTNIQVHMNFKTESIHVYVNGESCINYKINTRLFPEPKVALTFAGYSSNISPIQLNVHETSIYKGMLLSQMRNSTEVFHNDVDTFINTLDTYDPLHSKNASFSNIMLVQVSL